MDVARDDHRPPPRHGWLAAVIPAGARRFRVSDEDLAATLAASGGEVVDTDPDVEIVSAADLRGDAEHAIVMLHAPDPNRRHPRPLRAVRRLSGSATILRRVAEARRAAHRRGYREIAVVPWERDLALRLDLTVGSHRNLWQRFPLHAVVVATRSPSLRTASHAAIEAAEEAVGRRLMPAGLVLGSSGVLIGAVDDAVLRVSIGPAARRMEDQRRALASLRAARPSAVVSDRVPWVFAHGTAGLVSWSLERRLSGVIPSPRLTERLLADCLDFLGALHDLDREGADAERIAEAAAFVAASMPKQAAEVLHALGRRVEHVLGDLPRGFGHGDFWSGNLLADGGRLAGVVDWPSAGPGRLPMLDLLHLRVNGVREQFGERFGAVVVNELLPRARAGGDDLDRSYCRRIDLQLSSDELEALVAAYWLKQIVRDLVDPDRDPRKLRDPSWRQVDLELVLKALAEPRGVRGERPSVSRRVRT